MYEAIEKDNIAEVQQLIASGYDISQPLTEIPPEANHFLLHKPPLISVAAYFGSLKCLRLFLDQGLDVYNADQVLFLRIKVF